MLANDTDFSSLILGRERVCPIKVPHKFYIIVYWLMRKIVMILLCICSIGVFAAKEDVKKAKQLKADIEAAKSAVKNATDMEKGDNNAQKKQQALEKSEATMRKYLSEAEYAKRKDLHMLLVDLLRKQFEVGNNKMYLKLKTDTACYMKTCRRMFLAIETLDSVDAAPNEKGVSDPSYRKRHSEFLAPRRVNLLNGGVYFLTHKQWDEAWNSLDVYLDVRRQPLFDADMLDSSKDTLASYLALVAAYNLNDIVKARKYSAEAVHYTSRREEALRMLSDMTFENKDTSEYIKYVKEGFKDYPRSEYFFPRLIDYYTERGDYATSEKYADEALKVDSLKELFLLAKHSVLMSMEKYDESLVYGNKILQKNEAMPIVNYNIGYIYYLKAQHELKNRKLVYRARMKKSQSYYKKLLPYMERYRKAMPDDRARWYPILYDAYLNLNMGDEFRALEK